MIRIYLTLTYFYPIIVLKIRIIRVHQFFFKEHKMTVVGIIKEIDKLGRIVIPKELRKRFSLDKEVEIIATTEGVFIRASKKKNETKEEDRT